MHLEGARQIHAKMQQGSVKESLKLKNMSFKCGAGAEDLSARKYIHLEKSPDAYWQSIIKNILMNGACSICLRCKLGIDVQTCVLCDQEKDRSQFLKCSDYIDKWRCLECASPTCSNPDCKSISSSSAKQIPLPDYLWPKTRDEVLNFRGLACREK